MIIAQGRLARKARLRRTQSAVKAFEGVPYDERVAELRDQTKGGYRFLVTSPDAPFSAGVVALPGHEIVHAVARRHVPVMDGFAAIERHLRSLGRPREALCGMELRGPKPYTPEEWTAPDGFNGRYRAVLREWGLFVDGYPVVARTNVVPVVGPPAEQVLHAFSYAVPLEGENTGEPTFVSSGAPEDRSMWASDAKVDERLLSSLDAIGRAISGLGRSWDTATTVNVYVREGISTQLVEAALRRIGGAARHGLHWSLTKTPLVGPYLECDARGVRREVVLEV